MGDRTGYSAPWATADVLFTPEGQLLSYWDRTYNDWGFERFWVNGRMMAYYNPAAGTMRFEHVTGLDSASMVMDQTGGLVTDQLFYPWGAFWQGSDTEDPTFASLLGDDRTYGLYPAKFREYSSTFGRWLTPDALGGDITNPQSLNRYAYALNNPATLIDPQGLGDCNPNHDPECTGGNATPCYMDGLVTPCSIVTGALKSGFALLCNGPCPSGAPINVTGWLYGNHVNVNFDNWDQYANWLNTLASSPANQVYDAFWDLLENQGADPNQPHQVQVFWWGLLPNVGGMGPLNTANAAKGAISDPYKGTHPGGSFIKLWPPLDTPHCASGWLGGSCHNDAFSPILLLPFHELFDYLPSKFINPQNPNALVPRGVTTWSCAVIGGCHQ